MVLMCHHIWSCTIGLSIGAKPGLSGDHWFVKDFTVYLENLDSSDLRTAWIHAVLALSKKITIGSAKGNDDFRKMLEQAGSVENLYNDIFALVAVDEDIAKKVYAKLIKFSGVFKAVTIFDSIYPIKLGAHPGTPPIVYTLGDISLLDVKKSIAFVGTRELVDSNHIDHGARVIKRLLSSGVDAIVSGLASGSDTLGHKAAILFGGRTIAVLGTPLDMFYPKENRELQSQIAESDLLVSEYPIGVGSFGSYFANRNRTTVALSTDGVVVARAGDKSGTQYAIRICLEQNKQLYVLENNIRESTYSWVLKYKDRIKVIRENFDAGTTS